MHLNPCKKTQYFKNTCEYNLIANFRTSEVQRELFTTYLLILFDLRAVITQIMKMYDSVHKGVYFLKLFYYAFIAKLYGVEDR